MSPSNIVPPLSRRQFIAATSMSMMAGILAACVPGSGLSTSGPSAAGSQIADGLRLLRLTSDEGDAATVAFYRHAIDTFRVDNPQIDVDLVLISQDAKLQRALSAFATGADLGIFTPQSNLTVDWARAGYLLPLDDLIQEIGEADFLPGSRVIVDGSDYAMPIQGNVYGLWVRDDLLAAQGLSVPTTYEELLQTAEALNRDGVAGISLPVGTESSITATFFAPFAYQSGWDYFDREGNLTFDKPEVRDGVQRYVDLMEFAPPALRGNAGYFDVIDAYITGRAAMAIYSGRLGVNVSRQAPEIAANTSVHALPAGPVLTGQAFGGLRGEYVVHSATPHVSETLDLLKHLTTGQQGLEFAMTVPGHLLPQLYSVADLVPSFESEFMAAHSDWLTTLLGLVPAAMNPARDMGSVVDGVLDKVSNVMPWAGDAIAGTEPIDGTMFQRILLNGESVDAAWQWASAELKRVSDEWKSANPDWKPSTGS